MDTVTQQIAANSEESAAAAEEMSTMSVQMNDYVRELVVMVNGNSAPKDKIKRLEVAGSLSAGRDMSPQATRPATPARPALAALFHPASRKTVAARREKLEELIPMEEEF